ncbi:MAG: hypothetical protein L0Y72_20635 [Gemmataceae bacterium]|nr:hypothetical protein [Gemmataceae bacterium]MCI0741447.1 hypothetical protein [Gemmataceae bacterium]
MAIQIQFPEPNDEVTGTFMAQGRFNQNIRRLNAFVATVEPKCPVFHSGEYVPLSPGHWCFLFRKIPNGKYLLTLVDQKTLESKSIPVLVKGPLHVIKDRLGPIDYPPNNTQVLSTFVAYGACDHDTVTGSISDAAAQPETIMEPKNNEGLWSIRYSNITDSLPVGFSITVRDNKGETSITTGLTVGGPVSE